MKFPIVLIFTTMLGTHAWAETSSKQAPTVHAVFVVPEENQSKQVGVVIDTPKMEKNEAQANHQSIPIWGSPTKLPTSIWILLASMPILASLYFVYQIYLFFKARRKRLVVQHIN